MSDSSNIQLLADIALFHVSQLTDRPPVLTGFQSSWIIVILYAAIS